MQNIYSVTTPVGEAVLVEGDTVYKLEMAAGRAEGFLLTSEVGLAVWSERISSCILLQGPSEARGALDATGEPSLVLARIVNGQREVEFVLPAVDVRAMTPLGHSAADCRDQVVAMQATRALH